MPDYKEMYLTITRAANKALKLNQEAMEYIITAQQQAEDMYIEADDTPLSIIPPETDKQNSHFGTRFVRPRQHCYPLLYMVKYG
jgi:hypothetical protein